MSETPAQESARLHQERLGKWVKYNNRWYNPHEWAQYCRVEGKKNLPGQYADIEGILNQARQLIFTRTKAKEDVSDLLVRYFAFEKRVREYAEYNGRMQGLASRY